MSDEQETRALDVAERLAGIGERTASAYEKIAESLHEIAEAIKADKISDLLHGGVKNAPGAPYGGSGGSSGADYTARCTT